jgi:hypothetical protein
MSVLIIPSSHLFRQQLYHNLNGAIITHTKSLQKAHPPTIKCEAVTPLYLLLCALYSLISIYLFIDMPPYFFFFLDSFSFSSQILFPNFKIKQVRVSCHHRWLHTPRRPLLLHPSKQLMKHRHSLTIGLCVSVFDI